MTGSQGVAMGAANAGLQVYIGYPMTPSTGVLHEMAKRQNDERIVIQGENEIASISMALGASFSGAIAMTRSCNWCTHLSGTSWPWYCASSRTWRIPTNCCCTRKCKRNNWTNKWSNICIWKIQNLVNSIIRQARCWKPILIWHKSKKANKRTPFSRRATSTHCQSIKLWT